MVKSISQAWHKKIKNTSVSGERITTFLNPIIFAWYTYRIKRVLLPLDLNTEKISLPHLSTSASSSFFHQQPELLLNISIIGELLQGCSRLFLIFGKAVSYFYHLTKHLKIIWYFDSWTIKYKLISISSLCFFLAFDWILLVWITRKYKVLFLGHLTQHL